MNWDDLYKKLDSLTPKDRADIARVVEIIERFSAHENLYLQTKAK